MKKLSTIVAMALMACGAYAQETYILDINQIYDDAVNATGQCVNATLDSGTKYLLNETTYTQDIFTVVSHEGRTYRVDTYNGKSGDEATTYDYGDYVASARLEPNGASNATGGRQMFVEVSNAGTLYIGAWTGTSGRGLYVLPAEDKESFVDTDGTQETALLYESLDADAEDGQVFSVDLEPGLYCITQDASIYFGYVKFVESGTTGISSVEVATEDDADAPVYNLSGQRVSKDTKGIVIQNGKKFINK